MDIRKMLIKFNFSKGGNVIKYIVLHDTGNVTDMALGNAKYFSVDGRKASAHYFVDDKEIIQLVEDTDSAWHVGKSLGKITNKNSIGIEMCRKNNTVTEITEGKTIELVKFLMEKYNIAPENVVRHFDASGKNCPASFNIGDWDRWKRFKAKLNPTVIKLPLSILKKGLKGDDVKLLQELLSKKGFPIKADGDFGLQTENVVKLFQSKNGLVADGIVGSKTWEKLV